MLTTKRFKKRQKVGLPEDEQRARKKFRISFRKTSSAFVKCYTHDLV